MDRPGANSVNTTEPSFDCSADLPLATPRRLVRTEALIRPDSARRARSAPLGRRNDVRLHACAPALDRAQVVDLRGMVELDGAPPVRSDTLRSLWCIAFLEPRDDFGPVDEPGPGQWRR